MQRLGKNTGGYCGETIDIQSVLRDALLAAARHGWQEQTLLDRPDLTLAALHRPASSIGHPASSIEHPASPLRRLYLSTGIHGDEPAGPLAVRQLLQENRWPDHVSLWLCPCLNPTGFPLNRRENARGQDLNRQYHQPDQADEVRAHVAWLKAQPAFDLSLCLHEDWESNGFYLYELNPDQQPSLAERIIEQVASVCPIDKSDKIEGRPAKGGIIRPDTDPLSRPQWPEAFYLLRNKTRLSYTFEAPSDFPLPVRVKALITAVSVVLESLS